MENIIIDETKYTPKIVLDADKGEISFVGKSYPENTFEFYNPVMNWLEDYFSETKNENTIINFEIIYFNSSSSKLFFDFFDTVEEASVVHDVIINWIYDEENDSALEAGEDFIEDFENLNFNLVQK
ncbi:MAG: DUF1987 domain-containing protein [Campylobacteraceae bacterium]|nr:DUF1987 domain-containing protein [Campylobacteraceae bacterium]